MAIDLQGAYDKEADSIADSTMHTFNNVLMTLSNDQKLRCAKRLFKLIGDQIVRLEGGKVTWLNR